MIMEFKNLIPVVTPLGDGYAVYVVSNGQFDNDIWTVALCDTGQIRHFSTADIKMWANRTLGITKAKDESK